MSVRKEKRKYKAVANGVTDETEPFVLASGDSIIIKEMGVSAARSDTVYVAIVFDGEILIASHGDTQRQSDIQINGDGTKAIVIRLANSASGTETIGGYYVYEEIEKDD